MRKTHMAISIAAVVSAIIPIAVCIAATHHKSPHIDPAQRAAALRSLEALERIPPIKGVAFHLCSCAVPCPCMFTAKDVEGCTIVRAYHFTDGGPTKLAGLTALIIPHPENLKNRPGAVQQYNKPVDQALYIPAGLPTAVENQLVSTLAEHNMAVGWNNYTRHRVKISFTRLPNGYDITIPGVFHATTHSSGLGGKPVIVDNLSLEDGSRWTIGKSTVHDYKDPDETAWKWSMPNTNGSWTIFEWGPHVDPSDEVIAGRKYRGYRPPTSKTKN